MTKFINRLRYHLCKLEINPLFQGGRGFSTITRNSYLVYKSVSNDPYANLALEDWMYENLNLLSNETALLLWRNEPTVVIGRHQNPWKECNLELMKSSGINLVRRKSGGGTVYHDLGNINCTFFTSRSSYNRKKNLDFLARFLGKKYDFDVSLNQRDDLILNSKYKISGTAAKLGLKQAYHHCTLLCKVNTARLNEVLHPSYSGIFSNATRSVRSEIKNLFEDSTYDWEETSNNLARMFVIENGPSMNNWNEQLLEIDPLSQSHEILNKKYELLDWEWNFGKTPKFIFSTVEEFSFGSMKITMTVNKGIIAENTVECNDAKVQLLVTELLEQLKGVRFNRDDILMMLYQSLSSKTILKTSQEEQLLKEVSNFITTSMH